MVHTGGLGSACCCCCCRDFCVCPRIRSALTCARACTVCRVRLHADCASCTRVHICCSALALGYTHAAALLHSGTHMLQRSCTRVHICYSALALGYTYATALLHSGTHMLQRSCTRVHTCCSALAAPSALCFSAPEANHHWHVMWCCSMEVLSPCKEQCMHSLFRGMSASVQSLGLVLRMG